MQVCILIQNRLSQRAFSSLYTQTNPHHIRDVMQELETEKGPCGNQVAREQTWELWIRCYYTKFKTNII